MSRSNMSLDHGLHRLTEHTTCKHSYAGNVRKSKSLCPLCWPQGMSERPYLLDHQHLRRLEQQSRLASL